MRAHLLWLIPALAAALWAQAPAINPRGVLNAVTLEPAPSRVAPGGLLLVLGINLGPVEGWRSTTVPAPVSFGDPPTQVMIGGRAAALLSATPGRIVAQVPWETPQGLINVVVRRGETRSRAASVRVMNVVPAVRTRNDLGFGEAAAVERGSTLTLAGSGLGVTEPRVANGATSEAEAPVAPRAAVRALVGGLTAEASVKLSASRVGEFDIAVEVPEGAQAGDIIHVEAGAQAPGNRVVFGRRTGAQSLYLRLPEGAGAARQLRAADLRGDYLMASAPAGEGGCFPSWLFDLSRAKVSRIEPCLIAAQPNAQSPVMAVNEGSALASFVGPASGTAQSGFSKRVAVFQPARSEPIVAELPTAASVLAAGPEGNVLAVAGGEQPALYSIDALTGEVSRATAQGVQQPGGGGVGQPAPGGGGGVVVGRIIDPNVDIGDGLKYAVSTLIQVQNQFAVVIGDDPDEPNRVKLVVLDPRTSEVASTHDFPEGWVPLLPPSPPVPANRPPNAPAPQRPRAQGFFDGPTRALYLMARNPGGTAHALVSFTGEGLEAGTVALPEGWYFTACSANVPVFQLELSRRTAWFGSLVPEIEFKVACAAQGYVLLDLAGRQVTAVPLPGQGQITVTAGLGDLNDYLYGTNSDPGNRNLADTLYVLDSVAGSAFRIDLPAGITSFANVQPVASLSALLGVATDRVAGDAGLVWFDLAEERASIFPVPDGFQTVAPVAVFPNTRKLVARGSRQNGSQFLIYDLLNGDLEIVPNPEGVAWVGGVNAQPAPGQGGGNQPPVPVPAPGGGQQPGGQQGQVQQVVLPSTKSNWVAALAFGENRQPAGVMAVRIP